MPDEDIVIDVEAVELEETPNLPAVVNKPTNRSDKPIQAERDWPHGPSPDRRCTAHKKNGDQCKNAAIKGANVCRYHGGAAKQVKQAARARLDNAAELMAKQLLGLALTAESEGVQLAAVRDALDRTIGKAPTTVEIGPTKPYEEVFEGISSVSREASRAARGFASPDPPRPSAVDATDPLADIASGEYQRGVPSDVETQRSSQSEPPRQPRPDRPDREREPERQEQARSPRTVHITGMLAIQEAARVNREVGALPEPSDLPGGHRRYPRW